MIPTGKIPGSGNVHSKVEGFCNILLKYPPECLYQQILSSAVHKCALIKCSL